MPVRPYTAQDWSEVERINIEGIDTGHATFEVRPKSRINFETGALEWSILVYDDGTDRLGGWICLWPTSDRCCYTGIAEVSIYISAHARGKGVGTALMQAAITASQQNGIWTIVAGVFPENDASLQLHLKNGFRIVGTRERMGLMTYGPMEGIWRDNLLLERRSKTVGI